MLFTGPVDTRGHLDPDTRAYVADYLRTFPGQQVDIIVRKHRKQRTLKQNAYWHAEPFVKLAKKFGCSVDAAKLAVMGQFWGWEREPITGHEVPVKAHTSDMTVDEGTLFLDWLIPWAAEEHGVEILLPDEWKGDEGEYAATG